MVSSNLCKWSLFEDKERLVSGEVVYVVMGISEESYKEILSFCISGSEEENAEVWKDILRELKERGISWSSFSGEGDVLSD